MNRIDEELQRAIDSITPPHIAVAHRIIAQGDETALLPEELAAFASSVTKVRRASGAARIVARQLMSRFGRAPQAIRRSTNGAPMWPEGIVGSLAHDDRVAIAAMADRTRFQSIGIDIEPAEVIRSDLLHIIAKPAEWSQALADPYGGRLLFAIKEAVYKAVYPLDGRFLDHHDIEVSLSNGFAEVREGRSVHFRHCATIHIVVLAYVT